MTAPVQQQTNTKIPMTAPVQQQKNAKIPMTAPVQQQESSKMPMTSPVQQQLDGDMWKISFIMPTQFNIDTLPRPINERIVIKEIPAKKFIVIKFSGRNSNKNITKYEEILVQYAKNNDIKLIGPAKYAFYNPPWTLPMLRRNEIMFEL